MPLQIKPSSANPSIPFIRVLVQVLDTPLPNQHSANALGKAAAGGSNTWAPATNIGDQDGVTGSWVWPNRGMGIVVICRMNQQIEDLSLSLIS